jgi:uncharacterized membrane protein YbhN (UPF0104 family)
MHAAQLILCVSGSSLALLVGLAVFVTARHWALWVRYSWLLVAILAVPYGCLCFTREQYRPMLAFKTRTYLEHYETLFAGIVMGVIITLGIYGLLSLLRKKSAEGLTNR